MKRKRQVELFQHAFGDPGDEHERDRINVALYEQERESRIKQAIIEDSEVKAALVARKGDWNPRRDGAGGGRSTDEGFAGSPDRRGVSRCRGSLAQHARKSPAPNPRRDGAGSNGNELQQGRTATSPTYRPLQRRGNSIQTTKSERHTTLGWSMLVPKRRTRQRESTRSASQKRRRPTAACFGEVCRGGAIVAIILTWWTI